MAPLHVYVCGGDIYNFTIICCSGNLTPATFTPFFRNSELGVRPTLHTANREYGVSHLLRTHIYIYDDDAAAALPLNVLTFSVGQDRSAHYYFTGHWR